MMEAAALLEFKELKKEAVFEVRVGEYLSHSECVFRLDERERDSEEVRAWLQEKNDSAAYTYEDFMDLIYQAVTIMRLIFAIARSGTAI